MSIDNSPESTPAPQALHIGMVIFPGMTALDFAAPLDVFARLPGAHVHILAKTLEPVKTDIDFLEMPTLTMANAPKLDLLFIGGGADGIQCQDVLSIHLNWWSLGWGRLEMELGEV